jgi:hypothetical protein
MVFLFFLMFLLYKNLPSFIGLKKAARRAFSRIAVKKSRGRGRQYLPGLFSGPYFADLDVKRALNLWIG